MKADYEAFLTYILHILRTINWELQKYQSKQREMHTSGKTTRCTALCHSYSGWNGLPGVFMYYKKKKSGIILSHNEIWCDSHTSSNLSKNWHYLHNNMSCARVWTVRACGEDKKIWSLLGKVPPVPHVRSVDCSHVKVEIHLVGGNRLIKKMFFNQTCLTKQVIKTV